MTYRRKEIIGDCTLYLGDCREVLPIIEGGGDLAVVTDPPYGIDFASNPHSQSCIRHERMEWDKSAPSRDLFDLIRKVSEHQIIWGGNYFDLPPSQGFLIWDKIQPEKFSMAMAEYAWFSKKIPAKIYRQHPASFTKEHPTQKPVGLMKWCLDFLAPDLTILDPFMGSGTTGVACVTAGRRFLGIELEEKYFDIACRRITAARHQPELFAPSE